MVLEELIAKLESVHPATVVTKGFYNPHSYRGSYDELAFEPADNVTVAAMLACARSALGNTYMGYKGGDFTMNEWTPVHIAEYGCTGEEIGELLLAYMCKEIK